MDVELRHCSSPYTSEEIEALVSEMNGYVDFLRAINKDNIPSRQKVETYFYNASELASHLSFREEVFEHYGSAEMLTIAVHSVGDEAVRLLSRYDRIKAKHQASRNLYAFLALAILGVAVAILILR